MNFFQTYRQQPLRITKGPSQLARDPRRILLIQLGDIGDLVLSVPFMRSLKANFPSARLTVAARDKASDLVRLIPWSDGVLAIQKAQLPPLARAAHQFRFFRSLRSKRFDLAIDMRTGTRGAILAYLSGAPIRMGFAALDDTWRNTLFTHLVYPPMDMPMLHMAHYHLLLLDRYGLKVAAQWPRLRIDPALARWIRQLLAREQVPLALPLIAIQPFSLWRYKEWGAEKFRRLIQWMLEAVDVGVLVCGTGAEQGRIARMIQGIAADRVFNLAGKTDLAQYAALLDQCRLFIGCDSAGVHIAAAVGTPTATLYGPSSPDSWAPREPGHVVIRKDMHCVPCRQKGCDGQERSRCLEDLSVKEVAAALKPLLSDLSLAAETACKGK